MLFMVIERFRNRDPKPVGARFRERGRMLPAGVRYRASWIDTAGMRCFQLMEAPARTALDGWIAQWNDLIEFEVAELVEPDQFWSSLNSA